MSYYIGIGSVRIYDYYYLLQVLDVYFRDSISMPTEVRTYVHVEICIFDACHTGYLQLHQICRALLANEHGGPLLQMRMHPKQTDVCRDLTAVVIHVTTVLHCVTQSTTLQPLIQLLQNPGEQKV